MSDEKPARAKPLLGVAKGLFEVPDDIDQHDEEIRQMFEGGPIFPDDQPPGDNSNVG